MQDRYLDLGKGGHGGSRAPQVAATAQLLWTHFGSTVKRSIGFASRGEKKLECYPANCQVTSPYYSRFLLHSPLVPTASPCADFPWRGSLLVLLVVSSPGWPSQFMGCDWRFFSRAPHWSAKWIEGQGDGWRLAWQLEPQHLHQRPRISVCAMCLPKSASNSYIGSAAVSKACHYHSVAA